MQQRFIPMLGLALALSAGASFLVYRLIAGKVQAGRSTPHTQIVTAVRDLQIGALVAPEDVRLTSWSGAVPPRTFRKLEDVIQRGVTSPLYAGEPLLEQRLASKGAGAGLAPAIPPGKRAVSIRVNEVGGISGYAVPGTRVDVLVQGRPDRNGNRGEAFARTLLQNIEVLSAGQKHQRDIEGKPSVVQSVNLLVSPEEAELLSLANSEARLQLVLRNPIDVGRAVTKGWFTPDLLPGGEKVRPPDTPLVRNPAIRRSSSPPPSPKALEPAPVRRPAESFSVELWHGSKKTRETFALEGES